MTYRTPTDRLIVDYRIHRFESTVPREAVEAARVGRLGLHHCNLASGGQEDGEAAETSETSSYYSRHLQNIRTVIDTVSDKDTFGYGNYSTQKFRKKRYSTS